MRDRITVIRHGQVINGEQAAPEPPAIRYSIVLTKVSYAFEGWFKALPWPLRWILRPLRERMRKGFVDAARKGLGHWNEHGSEKTPRRI